MIDIVQDVSKFKWAGVPFCERYCKTTRASDNVLNAIRSVDPLLDLKLYLPTMRWHLVRFPRGFMKPFTTVWELVDNPDTGMKSQPGEWMVPLLRQCDTQGANANVEQEVDEHNAIVQKKIDEEQELIAKDMAKELRKPLKHLLDYGPDADYKEFW